MFTFKDMLAWDVRELSFWKSQAELILIDRRFEMVCDIRMAQAQKESVERFRFELERRRLAILGTSDEVIKRNWEILKEGGEK
jgi:hypothetical protein